MDINSTMPLFSPLTSPPVNTDNQQSSAIINAVTAIHNTADTISEAAPLPFTTQPEPATLSHLPPEIRRRILQFMPAETRQTLANVSQKWSAVYQIDNSYLCSLPVNVKEKIFGKLDVQSRISLLESSSEWRRYYKARTPIHDVLIKRQKDGREVRFNLNSAIPAPER